MNLPPGFREIPDPEAEVRRIAADRAGLEIATISRRDLGILLAVATLHLDTFTADDRFTVPETFRYQDVEDVVKRYGRR